MLSGEIDFSDALSPFISVIDTGDATIVTAAGFGPTWCKDELGIKQDISYIDDCDVIDDEPTEPDNYLNTFCDVV